MCRVTKMLDDLACALPETVDVEDTLTAVGMLATMLLSQVSDVEDRAALTENFCSTLKQGAGFDLN